MGEKASESLCQSREEAPRKQEDAAAYGPLAFAESAAGNKGRGDVQQNKIVITEMDEFVLGLQLNAGNLLDVFTIFLNELEVHRS